ncbi:MAG: carboxylating nicotinate-nucleotide diphosphorylase [Verrucomicrobia bacterium]|nr:carboxylating nicotinate-nucleotide diphosphorylase [Verrucomicrobiota bacterium]
MIAPNLPDVPLEAEELIGYALAEDVGSGDATSQALVPADAMITAVILARGALTVCGNAIARDVFDAVDDSLAYVMEIPDGDLAAAGQVVATIRGKARSILTAERTALNFMQRLSGISTLTRRFVDTVNAHDIMILDTRKTTPGWRELEKYAVRCGGGHNHRTGLYDRILIKDNHRRLWGGQGGRSLAAAIIEARQQFPDLLIEIEVESVAELKDAIQAKPDWVLLDNMTIEQLRDCVRVAAGACRLEASGGITMDTIADVAATGVDAVSLGCLTHSAPAVDLSLEIIET